MGYNNQSDMFQKRAESNEKTAKAEYAMYKKAKELGNKEEVNSHYLKLRHYYKSAEENKMKAKENEGKDFSKKKPTVFIVSPLRSLPLCVKYVIHEAKRKPSIRTASYSWNGFGLIMEIYRNNPPAGIIIRHAVIA